MKTTIVGYHTHQQPIPAPADAFNGAGIAVLVATGTRYGGEWLVNLLYGPAENPAILGAVWTEATDDPDVAAATVAAWLAVELPALGLKVAGFVSHNDRYAPAERPYFTTSQVCVVDKDWV